MKKDITWIHLSDIHFGAGNRKITNTRKIVTSHLLHDISKQVEVLGQPDFIFITGDIAHSASREQYDEAYEWILSLLKIVKIKDCEIDQTLFLVPGNHDVARGAVTNNFISNILHKHLRSTPEDLDEAIQDPEAFKILESKFKEYIKFQNKLYEHGNFMFYEKQCNKKGIDITIVGLNTAITSYDNKDSNDNLSIGTEAISTIFDNNSYRGNLRLILHHHPASWLKDGRDFIEAVSNYPHILFHGHIHSENSIFSSELKGVQVMQLSSGAVHTDHGNEYCYSWGKLNNKGISYFPRKYYGRRFVEVSYPSENAKNSEKTGKYYIQKTEQLPFYLRQWVKNTFIQKINNKSESTKILMGLTEKYLNEKIANCKKHIKILQTSLPERNEIFNNMEKALENNAKITILLPSLKSPHLKYREKEHSLNKGALSRQLENTISVLDELKQSTSSSNLEVRFYKTTPVVAMYWIDETIHLGIFWRKYSSSQGMNLIIKSEQSEQWNLAKSHWETVYSESLEKS